MMFVCSVMFSSVFSVSVCCLLESVSAPNEKDEVEI
jgi:hypothetical protein